MKTAKFFTGSLIFIFVLILLTSSIQRIIYYNIPVNLYQDSKNVYIYDTDEFYLIDQIQAIPVDFDNNLIDDSDYDFAFEIQEGEDVQVFNSNSIPVSLPSVAAQSAILIDTDSGDIIYELNSNKRLPMASTTKIITAIVAIESGMPLDKIITITKKMTGAEGSSIYLYQNERFTLNDLLYALLLNSANDAAEAIAISVAGSIEKFAEMMNEKVKELNLKDSNFTNPHGLDNEMHYTTAYDLAKITAHALENEIFVEIASAKNKIIYPKNADGTNNESGARYLRNHNKMLRLYKDAIGVKTGFTKRSGRCLVSAAERNGTKLVAVTLNASDDWNDHIEMLDYGFANYRNVELCKEHEYKFNVNIVNGYKINQDGKKENLTDIKCENIHAESASLPNSINRENIESKIELPQFIYAPVKKGDMIGRIVFMYKDRIVGYSVIAACEDVGVRNKK